MTSEQATTKVASEAPEVDFLNMDAADLDRFIESGSTSASDQTAMRRMGAAQNTTAADAPAPPAGCMAMYLGSLAIRCGIFGEGTPSGTYLGTDAASVMPPNPFCQEVALGQLIYGVTPAPGSLACYQFTVLGTTQVDFQTRLPDGIAATAEIHRMFPNGSGAVVSRSASPASPLAATATLAYSRFVLIIRTSNGTGGQVFGVALNAPVPQPLPSNTTPSDARSIDMNEQINEVLAGPLDSAYYFFPFRIGQTSAMVTANFVPANLQVGVRPAQKTGPNSYAVLSETVLTSAYASGTPTILQSAYPANSTTSTVVSGLMLRVTGNNPAAANQNYGVRIGVSSVTHTGYSLTNTENISRYYPGRPGILQVARYVTIPTLGIKDQNGAWVKNHPARLTVMQNTNDPNTTQVTNYKSNFEGKVALTPVLVTAGTDYSITTTFASCTGDTISQSNYGPYGSPSDHWNGTAQPGSVNLVFPGTTFSSTLPFTRMCTETYLGRY